jgi:sugar O-acyltransferase (sialic acid O-acetyltransferase NeuD family)
LKTQDIILQKSLIFGTGDLAELLYYHLEKNIDNMPKVCGFTINQVYLSSHEFCGLPVTPFEDIFGRYSPDEYGIFVCVGYKEMNKGRRKAFEGVRNKGYNILSFIHPAARIDTLDIGEGTIAMPNVVVGEFCTIGEGNIFYHGSMLAHHSHIGSYNFFAVDSCVAGHVKVGDGCFFGAHSTVRNGLTIGDYTLTGANAYVEKNTAPFSVVVPARSMTFDGVSSLDMKL